MQHCQQVAVITLRWFTDPVCRVDLQRELYILCCVSLLNVYSDHVGLYGTRAV